MVRPLIEQPSSLKYSLLSYGPKLVPGKYAWLTDRQVWTGVFDFATKSGHAVGVVGEVLPLPEVTPSSENQEDKYPNSLVLTDFHALLSYPDRVVGVRYAEYVFLKICTFSPFLGTFPKVFLHAFYSNQMPAAAVHPAALAGAFSRNHKSLAAFTRGMSPFPNT